MPLINDGFLYCSCAHFLYLSILKNRRFVKARHTFTSIFVSTVVTTWVLFKDENALSYVTLHLFLRRCYYILYAVARYCYALCNLVSCYTYAHFTCLTYEHFGVRCTICTNARFNAPFIHARTRSKKKKRMEIQGLFPLFETRAPYEIGTSIINVGQFLSLWFIKLIQSDLISPITSLSLITNLS